MMNSKQMNTQLFEALDELERAGIPKDLMKAKIVEAIKRACQKEFGGKNLAGQNSEANIEIILDEDTKELKVYLVKDVVEELTDPVTQILLEDAKKKSKRITAGKQIKTEVKTSELHRISAKAAKDTIIQGIREAETAMVRAAYANKVEKIVVGTIRSSDKSNGDIFIETDTGMITLPYKDQIPGDIYRPGAKLKVYISKVTRHDGSIDTRVSRVTPDFIRLLFKLEIPEIDNGTVVIKNVAREAGSRAKVAVYSEDESLDPVGACIGQRGMRISAILNELPGEKIDIIKYSEDPAEYVKAALAPATVDSVEILDETEKLTRVTVAPDQLSLAIGKEGQNARLAARLTKFKIDIKAE